MRHASELDTDALISGAGPTGRTLGIALLLQGKRVRVTDKHLKGLPYSRAILINGETMRSLEPLGVCASLRAAGQPVDGIELHVDGAVPCTLHGATGASGGPLLLPQLLTEQILSERYLQLGGALHRGYRFELPEGSCDGSAGAVDLLPIDASQPVLAVQYLWLFGCDGMDSAVRSALGLTWRGRSQREPGHAIDARLRQWTGRTNVALHASAAGVALILRIAPLTVRIAGTTAAQCHQVLRQLPVEAITWESSFNIQFRSADCYGKDQTWLAGDATHVHSPIGGRGLNMGMADALALAEAIARQDIDAYVAQRKPVAARWVRINYGMSRVLMGSALWSQLLRWALRFCVRLLLAGGGERLLQPLFMRIIRVDETQA